jgi:cytochrome c biogenesis protein CcmG/thiol:disulfide interchange protein DsbE
MKFNWLMVLPFAIFLAVGGIWLWQLQNNQFALQQGVDTTALRSVQQGNPAPGLDLDPLADKTLLTRDMLEGEGLIAVNFFASWCPPCRVEHPILTALAEAGMPLYGVNNNDRVDQALSFLTELGDPYDAIGRDDRAGNGLNWGIVAMPETFFIDENGVIVLHFRGPVTRRSIENQIAPALAEAGHALPEIGPLTE